MKTFVRVRHGFCVRKHQTSYINFTPLPLEYNQNNTIIRIVETSCVILYQIHYVSPKQFLAETLQNPPDHA